MMNTVSVVTARTRRIQRGISPRSDASLPRAEGADSWKTHPGRRRPTPIVDPVRTQSPVTTCIHSTSVHYG